MILYNGGYIIMYLFKPIKCATPGKKSNENYGFWVTMMCHVSNVSAVSDVPLWWRMLITGESMHICEQEVDRKSL
jgi:hypothetical protein